MSNRFAKLFFMATALIVLSTQVSAQEPVPPVLKPRPVSTAEPVAHTGSSTKSMAVPADSIIARIDSTTVSQQAIEAAADSSQKSLVVMSEHGPADAGQDSIPIRWVPDSKKAMWMAIAFPGGGQIYNRKYWKLPIIYGGFIGCVYALKWNDTMYRDYSQAYIDIMDDDPNTKSYEDFVPIGYNVQANETRLKELFKRKKNYYRRYRDLSMFCMIGVYALSILDAYVDAELSEFDIDKDLSLKVRPSVITSHDNLASRPSMMPNSYGVQCCLSF